METYSISRRINLFDLTGPPPVNPYKMIGLALQSISRLQSLQHLQYILSWYPDTYMLSARCPYFLPLGFLDRRIA